MVAVAIDSVLSQNHDSCEVVVVNDGSSVSYDALYEAYADKITYIAVPQSGGVSSARNHGIAAAKGEWVIFLDDDDHFNHGYLNALNKEVDSHKDLDLFWCDIKVVLSIDNGIASEKLITFPTVYESMKQVHHKALSIGAGYGLAVRKKVLDRLGTFDTTLRVGEDTDLILKLISNDIQMKSVSYVGVTRYESHKARLSYKYKSYSKHGICERLFERYGNFFANNKLMHRGLLKWCVKIHLDNDNFLSAIAALHTLNEIFPAVSLDQK
jgi:glycosyltransferase involved in cell wall biosynthesis